MVTEEERRAYITRALNREKIVKATDLSTIELDFYSVMRDELAIMPEKDQDAFKKNMNLFLNGRIGKLLRLAAMHPVSNEIMDKLADEERGLYRIVRNAVEQFRDQVYEGSPKSEPEPQQQTQPTEPSA